MALEQACAIADVHRRIDTDDRLFHDFVDIHTVGVAVLCQHLGGDVFQFDNAEFVVFVASSYYQRLGFDVLHVA